MAFGGDDVFPDNNTNYDDHDGFQIFLHTVFCLHPGFRFPFSACGWGADSVVGSSDQGQAQR